MSKRIGVLGLSSNKNIGDYLLVEATRHLLARLNEDIELVDIDIDPRARHHYRGVNKIRRKLFTILRNAEPHVFATVRSPRARYAYQWLYWHLKLHWHLDREIRNLDALVFSGGGFIKFQTQGLNYLDQQVIALAEKRDIPIMMSAVGIEHYDAHDLRCQRLKKALNSPIVRVITTRDDIATLNDDYITNPDTVTDRVADPVLWLGDMVKPRPVAAAPLIGINLVNPENFVVYGGNLARTDVVDFYARLLTELRNRGENFELFTNGMAVDVEFGRELLSRLGLPPETLLDAPVTSSDLIDDLARYDIILASRMHAGIVACALGKPVVGLIWSNKIELFSQIAGIRSNYFDENELDADRIAGMLAERRVTPMDFAGIEVLKNKTVDYLRDFIRSLG